MTHREFATSTPREINERIDGYDWRLSRQMEREAKWVCAILNGAGRMKNPVRPERLLGRPLGSQHDARARGTTQKKA